MRPTLLYDGDCGFCTRSVEVLQRRIPADVDARPWQLVDPAELTELGVPVERLEREVVWVGRDHRTAGGVQAFARYVIEAGGGWRAFGRLLRLPPMRWVGAAVYRLIARYRYRLPGGTPACAVRHVSTKGHPDANS